MKINVKCAQCGNTLAVDEKFAGKKGKCPKCGAVFVIQPPAANAAPAAPPARPAATPKSAPAPAPKVTAGTVSEGPKSCLGCGKAVDAKAVICMNCGYNFKTGKKLNTIIEKSAPEPETPDKEADNTKKK
jgi:phage FluMu protein Com